jgi:transposase
MGSINLMCFVLIAKYGDGLPLYRQESILARYGVNSPEPRWPIG